MTCRLKGTLRSPERLVGRLTGTRLTGPDGLYLGGIYQGVVDGYYEQNERLPVPDGYWQGGHNTGALSDGLYLGGAFEGVVDGYYEQNQRVMMADGIWIGEVYQGTATGYYVDNVLVPVPDGYWSGGVLGPVPDGIWQDGDNAGLAQGYYVNNSPSPIPDGCYRNGGLVDPYYEAIIKAAQAEGGGLYLFQLEYGEYAGQQVIWQDAGGTTPWEPGLSTPQGKVLDLCGSGEFLSQSVSIRRPVDGVWDGVGTWMDASSDAVGGHLHQARPSGAIMSAEILGSPVQRVFWATKASTSALAGDGMLFRGHTDSGLAQYTSSDRAAPYLLALSGLGIDVDGQGHCFGVVNSGLSAAIYSDGVVGPDLFYTPYPDTPASGVLRVGANTAGGAPINAKIDYIAIYTREPTPYEISLHKRTP